MIKVLFVCSGNICRSPMADAVFKDKVKKAGLSDQIQVDSAGTGSWHVGEQAHHGTRKILKENNISYHGRARQMTNNDLKTFDYILAMDQSHLRHIERMQDMSSGNTDPEVAMFLSYANDAGLTEITDVIDPYYNGRFQEVYDLVDVGSKTLLEHIQKQHNL